MKVITSIYLNCRPDLRDEWLTGTEGDDVQASLVSHWYDQRVKEIITMVFRLKNKRFESLLSSVRQIVASYNPDH